MKQESFTIERDVHGVYAGQKYDYPKGTLTPRDAAERAVIEHLVGLGLAKPAKKEA
jgi:hypothetical protein